MSRATFVFSSYEGPNPVPVIDELFNLVNGTLVPNNLSGANSALKPRCGVGLEDAKARPSGTAERQSLSSPVAQNSFDGETFVPELDRTRLKAQLVRVRECMKDGQKRSLAEIAKVTGDPESSVSARLRDLRKSKNGLWTVNRERRSPGAFEYWLGDKGL